MRARMIRPSLSGLLSQAKEKSDIVIGGKVDEIGIVAVVLEFGQYFKVIGLGRISFGSFQNFLLGQPQCQNSRPQCPSIRGRDLKTLFYSIQVLRDRGSRRWQIVLLSPGFFPKRC